MLEFSFEAQTKLDSIIELQLAAKLSFQSGYWTFSILLLFLLFLLLASLEAWKWSTKHTKDRNIDPKQHY